MPEPDPASEAPFTAQRRRARAIAGGFGVTLLVIWGVAALLGATSPAVNAVLGVVILAAFLAGRIAGAFKMAEFFTDVGDLLPRRSAGPGPTQSNPGGTASPATAPTAGPSTNAGHHVAPAAGAVASHAHAPTEHAVQWWQRRPLVAAWVAGGLRADDTPFEDLRAALDTPRLGPETFTNADLALIANVVDAEPLAEWTRPPDLGAGYAEAVARLVGRGVLRPCGEGHELTPDYLRLLGPVMFAARCTTISASGRPADDVFLRAGGHAVRHVRPGGDGPAGGGSGSGRVDGELHELEAVEDRTVGTTAAMAIRSQIGGEEASRPPVVLEHRWFVSAQTQAWRDVEAAVRTLPEGAKDYFRAAAAPEARSVQILDVRRGDDPSWTFHAVQGGPAGAWTADGAAMGDHRLQRCTREDALARAAQVVDGRVDAAQPVAGP